MMFDVSIIIPVYNGEKTLPLCLDSLIKLDYPREKLEIIVVDNDSRDASANIIKQYPVRYTLEERKGETLARNRGIRVSSGDLVAFLDQDCIADINWVKRLVEGFESDNIAGCGGPFLSYHPETLIEKYIDTRNFFLQEESITGKRLFLPHILTGNSIYRREVLDKVGLFDESLWRGGDVDISWRICLKGYQLRYIPDAIVYHKHRDNLSALFKQFFDYGYGSFLLFRKYKKINKNLVQLELLKSFIQIQQRIAGFLCNFFLNKDRLTRVFSLFDIVRILASLGGKIYGPLRLKLEKRPLLQLPKPANKIIWWRQDENVVISNLDNLLSCYYLEKAGARMWELMQEKRNEEEIVNIIEEEYEANREEIKRDFSVLLNALKEKKLR